MIKLKKIIQCEHEFVPSPSGYLECPHCRGIRPPPGYDWKLRPITRSDERAAS